MSALIHDEHGQWPTADEALAWYRATAAQQRDALGQMRHCLTALAKCADDAAMVLAVIEAESTDEETRLQAIIDGISTWAPAALREGEGSTLDARIAAARLSADYAWKNARVIDQARQEEMRRRDELRGLVREFLALDDWHDDAIAPLDLIERARVAVGLNVPHEGPGAASSRTVPLNAAVGRQAAD